ncbi:hypothetical protein QUC31_003086 [Theobroma cacao]|uniref:Pentatricopeptide repeat-containing protein DOT4, chloroplastic n=2 Tax=Theobroma cacao TaxID=3641 RepID=A0AB32VNF0_THECC|nr:PREDICTED: pentatricopeptide repeat-containing protein DOT4, chloroplastic [Theobroma cacao]EOX91375.1 Pentatricopeptide repeat-containing protein, putative [Theobroma cacao]
MNVWRSQGALSTLSKPRISLSQLNNLLQLCSKSKSLSQGKQIHPQIISNGSHQNTFIITKLVQMYADCDDLVSANKLFDRLPQPNVFSWTAILGLYSRHGMYRKCIESYCEMKMSGVLPDGFVFPKVLRASVQGLCLETGICVHKDVIVCGCEFYLEVCNSLIDMYGRCGDLTSARRVFDEMVGRDLFSWNLMISGYVGNGMLEFGLEILNCMRLDGFEPDVVTWNMVMDGYCRMGRCDEALKIFEYIKEPNIISWTTLISGYSRIGQHESSLRIFKDMLNKGVVLPDLDCLSSALVSCRHLGALLSGKEIHGFGIKMMIGRSFYGSAGPALLTLHSKCGRSRDAGNIFELMDKSDTVTWNAMILGFVDRGLGHMAVDCFGEMQRMGIKNDQTTICTVLPVCELRQGKQLHAYIRRQYSDSICPIWNALVHMYSKCGSIGSAYSVFSNMVARDLVSWNTMIGGFALHGLGEAALQLLKEMNYLGVCPSPVTLTSALSACNHSGLVDEGLKVFSSMTRGFHLSPSMEHFACVVDMLSRAGRLEDAINFIEKMPLKPDKCIWGALLAACRAYHNIDVAKVAAEHLICLEPEQAGHYITLSNIYAKAGRWNDAVRVRKQMETKGSAKPSGQSWLESGS